MNTKKILLSCICIISSVCLFAQPISNYRNAWIDYNKTYYKFELGPFGLDYYQAPVPAGVVRITGATLSAEGLGGVPVEQLQLWHDGRELPLYTSIQSGTLGPT